MSHFPWPDIWYTHRVSYGETDAMKVLYYAEYLHIFERSRSAYIRAFGIPYTEVEERGLILPVREAGCRYRAPARYDDVLHIRAGIRVWQRASFIFDYEVYNESRDILLATGFTQHACVNPQGKPVAVPEWFYDLFH